MALYSFSLQSLKLLACRSAGGQDDLWLIMTVNIGTRISDLAVFQVGPVPQGQTASSMAWSAGPYQAVAGETGVTTYTLVNLSGSGEDDQGTVITGLGATITGAVTSAARGESGAAVGAAAAGAPGGVVAATIEATIRRVFGGAGELPGAPPPAAGAVDCRGLVGVYVAPFTAPDAPLIEEVETTAPMTLSGTAPATCGTTPQSTAVFSVRRAPSLFSQSTPVTVLASAPAVMEMFAVGMDGLVRYNVRSGKGTFGAWQVAGARTFSQSAPLVAIAGTAQRKDVFGTGTDGVIFRMSWTEAAGWGDWTAVSVRGQFLPDTPVSAISLTGFMSLFAVDPDGVPQSMTWNGDAVRDPWGSLPGVVLGRRTPLLVISHIETLVEVFAVNVAGQDYHTSRAVNVSAWGPFQQVGAASAIAEPASRRYLGLTFDVFSGPNVSTGKGMIWFRVDGGGGINQLGWTDPTGWIGRSIIQGIKTIFAGSVSGVRLGNQLLLYTVDGRTGQIGVTSWPMPVPFGPNPGWTAWTLLPPGPALAKEREITAISTDDSHVELFVVDRQGVVQHVTEDTGPGWGTWSAV